MAGLFGLGLIITLLFYGAAVAQVGKYVGLDNATRGMYVAAGLPSLWVWSYRIKDCQIQDANLFRNAKVHSEKGDYIKIFLLGLLLGNAGIGCPNSVTYIILIFSASSGDWMQGTLLMTINGIGRVVPLLFLTALGPHAFLYNWKRKAD